MRNVFWYHYQLKYKRNVAHIVQQFVKLATYNGVSVEDVFLKTAKDYIDTHQSEVKIVNEQELLIELKKLDLSVTRNTLLRWRKYDAIRDEDGKKIWYTNGFFIFYDLKKMIEFVRTRRKILLDNPTSRLVAKKKKK